MRNIILIGPMAAGKTTVGKALATELQRNFIDTDDALEVEQGQNMTTLYTSLGDAAFRELETDLLARVLTTSNHIIATGGGVVLRPENRALLQHHGNVVFLDVSVSTQVVRLREDESRPLLQGYDRSTRLQELSEIRRHWCEQIAQHRVATDNLCVDEIVRCLMTLSP
ncbi:MAG: shikimate kinase [Pseudomonadota bacterium]|nr:shikimate kinase [Pseudomonadota bacterium]